MQSARRATLRTLQEDRRSRRDEGRDELLNEKRFTEFQPEQGNGVELADGHISRAALAAETPGRQTQLLGDACNIFANCLKCN